MHITIIATGKLKERFWKEACAEYQKRLSRYVQLSIVELDDLDPAKHGGESQARALETQAAKKAIKPGSYVVCLDSHGKQLDSLEFAKFIDDCANESCKDLVFVIGGSTGIDDCLKNKADKLLSFGKITLPHNLARIVALEQIYRAYRINRGEPYHK